MTGSAGRRAAKVGPLRSESNIDYTSPPGWKDLYEDLVSGFPGQAGE
jgi:hypothetical protein